MKHDIRHSAMSSGYEIQTVITHNDIMQNIDKRVFHIVVEKLAEDLYNKHKDEIINSMSVKSLIKATYKKLESDMYRKLKKVLEK
jgi:hypothetical protein